MNPPIHDAIETALAQAAPIEALRQLAIDLNNDGIGKAEILDAFQTFDLALKDQDMDQASDYLEEVIDMLTGHYLGRNLDLK